VYRRTIYINFTVTQRDGPNQNFGVSLRVSEHSRIVRPSEIIPCSILTTKVHQVKYIETLLLLLHRALRYIYVNQK
jgi:hypothetical protein